LDGAIVARTGTISVEPLPAESRSGGSHEPYLIGAICNASRLYWRRNAAADELFCAETPCAATPGDALQEAVEQKLLLTRVLARIGAKCRDLLQRYYLNGETTEALAVRFHSTPGSIRVRIFHCRDRARSAVACLLESCSDHGAHS
jgi:DNA-directed RNA polymerase specialized sigma24 family protein